MKKYELTGDTINVFGKTLHRIRATRDFSHVHAGDLGGFIEDERNLSHDENAWVGGNARVSGNAWVGGNALVGGNAWAVSYTHLDVYKRQELTRRQIFRDAGKPIRRTLTDAIRDSGEDGRMHGHAYGTYTDLAYKAATGKIARVLRKERGASAKAISTDFLTSDELSAYNKAEERLTVLLDMGLTYDQIKTLLLVQRGKRMAG